MNDDRKILLIDDGGAGLLGAGSDRSLNIVSKENYEPIKGLPEMKIGVSDELLFIPPITRKERRALKRKNRK